MARAYEQSGDLESAQKTLDAPGQGLSGDALRERGAVPARRAALHGQGLRRRREGLRHRARRAPKPTPYQDRSLYMLGWSQYKQGRLEDGLKSFFGVLDLKVAGRGRRGSASTSIPGLSRADRELVEDTFRVASISLANLQGAESIPAFIDTPARQDLRVPRLRAARRALHQAGAPQGRGRHLQPVRAQEPAARAGAGDAGARDRDLREDRLHQPGDRGAQGIHRPLRPHERVPRASTPTAGTRRSRSSRRA